MKILCHKCEKDEKQVKLERCRICFKHFCDEHSQQKSGVSFCSRGCAEFFFFVDPDE